MFIVGVDIAKRSHEAIVIDDSGSIVKKAFNFKNDSVGFKKLIEALNSICTDPSDFVIGMESTARLLLVHIMRSGRANCSEPIEIFCKLRIMIA